MKIHEPARIFSSLRYWENRKKCNILYSGSVYINILDEEEMKMFSFPDILDLICFAVEEVAEFSDRQTLKEREDKRERERGGEERREERRGGKGEGERRGGRMREEGEGWRGGRRGKWDVREREEGR